MLDGEGVFPGDFRALAFDTYDLSVALTAPNADIASELWVSAHFRVGKELYKRVAKSEHNDAM